MTTSVSVPAARLRDMLAAVLPHAAGEEDLPALEAVRFEVRDGTLFLVASDRYSIGIARCRIPGAQALPEPDVAALLPLCVTKDELPGMLERAEGTAALIFGEETLTVDTGNTTATYGVDGHPEHFPDWRSLMSDMLAGEPAELGAGLGIDPEFLGRFAVSFGLDKDLRAIAPLTVRFLRPSQRMGVPLHAGEQHPVLLVSRGDWFLGAMMPLRLDRDRRNEPEDPWAAWVTVTAPGEPAEAVAE